MTDREILLSCFRERLQNSHNDLPESQSDLEFWKTILQIGSRCHARLNTLAKRWWDDREVEGCEMDLKNLRPSSEAYGWPWQLENNTIRLSINWLEQAEDRMLQAGGGQQFAKAVLGIIRSADFGLAEFIKHYFSAGDPIDEVIFSEQLFQHQLVPLPQKRRWSLFTNVARSTFYEGLMGVCHTARPVRLWSKAQLGFTPTPEEPQRPRIQLLAVCPEGDLDFRVQNMDGYLVFVVDHLRTPAELETVLQRFEQTNDMEADIYLLPEMAVGEADRRRLQDRYHQAQLSPRLIIAGSGHVGLSNPDEQGAQVLTANRSTLIHPAGSADHEPDVFHHKYEPFRLLMRGNPVGLNVPPELEAEVGSASEMVEGLALQGGTDEYPLVCADTPWGRISFVICKDILDRGNNSSLAALQDVGVDHLFVPSFRMGNRDEFQASASSLRLHNIATYVADGHRIDGDDADAQARGRFVVFLPVPRPKGQNGEKVASYDVAEWPRDVLAACQVVIEQQFSFWLSPWV